MTQTGAQPGPRFDFLWTQNHPQILDVLALGYRITAQPFFSPLNKLARPLLVAGARSLLSLKTGRAFSANRLRWQVRHSALEPADFQLLHSDIDLAAIWQRTPSSSELNLLALEIRRLRAFFPVLGEVEVYTQGEWGTRQKIRKAPGMIGLLQVLWDFRKMHWLEEELGIEIGLERERPMHSYHRQKKVKALQNSFRKLGEVPAEFFLRKNLSRGFEKHLEKVFSQLGFPKLNAATSAAFYCDYLQCHFNLKDNSQSLQLASPLALGLLAVLPPAQDLRGELLVQVNELRSHPNVRRARSLVLLHEWLVVKSRQRSHPDTAGGNDFWLRALQRELRLCGPINWQRLVE